MIKMIRIISLMFILTACGTAPIVDPPAHACSPRLDGKPTNCPTDPDDLKPSPPLYPRPVLKGEVDIYNPIHWEQFRYMYLRNRMLDKLEKNMTKPSDAINNALTEFYNGSNDTTEQKELLQLQSDGD